MKTIVLLVIASVCFVPADLLPSTADVVRHAVARRDTRQSVLACAQQSVDIFANYPDSCTDAFTSLFPTDDVDLVQILYDFAQLQSLDQVGDALGVSLENFGAIFCDPPCGNPLVQLSQKCLGEASAKFLIDLCSQNANGARCYNLSADFPACSALDIATCEGNCVDELQTAINTIDCCINLLDIGGLVDATGQIESTCDIDVPGPCGGSTLSSAMTVFATSAVILGLAVLAVITTQ